MTIYNYITIGSMLLMTLLILIQTRGASLGAGLGSAGEINTERRGTDKIAGRDNKTTKGLITELIAASIRPDIMTTHSLLPSVSNSTLLLSKPAAIHKPRPQTNHRTKKRYIKPLSIFLILL